MSLVALISRVALQQALLNVTAAGTNVINSPLDALDTLLTGKDQRPLVAVYSGTFKFTPIGRDLTGVSSADQRGEMIIQIYLPPGDIVVEGLELAGRDAGAGVALDFIWRQIQSALADPLNPWAELFRQVVRAFPTFAVEPVLFELEDGVSVACREVTLGCKFIADPPVGLPINGVWERIDAALRAAPTVAPLADVVKALIERPGDMPSWRITQQRMGWTDQQVRNSGVAPFDLTETGEAPLLSATLVADADRGAAE